MFNVDRDRVVMVAGVSFGTPLDDTWEFDGFDWHPINTPNRLTPRENHVLAYDLARDAVVAYGGFPPIFDTWEYSNSPLGRFVPYGSGCTGSAGTPRLQAPPGVVPTLGQTFTMDVLNLPPTAAFVFGAVGESRTTNLGTPLPLSLAPLGMTGCALFVGNLNLVGVPANGGAAVWSLPIPNSPTFIGYRFFPQVAVPDATANPAGLTVSNAAEAWIN